MIPGGGRAKGANFERKTAKLFAAWFGRTVSRTPLSGGWGNNAAFETSGDLICQGGWPFCIELKAQEGWHLEQLIVNDKCPILAWWKQSCDAARLHKKPKMPILVFTRNHQPSYLMIKRSDFEKLSPDWLPLGSLIETVIESTVDLVYIMLLTDFFNHVRPPKPSPNHNQKITMFPQFKKKKGKHHGKKSTVA